MQLPGKIPSLAITGTLTGLLAVGTSAQVNLEAVKSAPKEPRAPMPHINPDDPSVMNLSMDKSLNIWRQQDEALLDPNREHGPKSVQRYELQLEPVGIKTFFQRPVALSPEDLKVGKVDVAIFGAPTGALPHSAGNMWAPAEIRYTRDYGGYASGSFELNFIEYETLLNPFSIINVVDYGDAALNPYNQAHTLEEIRRITREIAETGAIPFAIGGDHAVPNGTYRGIVDVYGRENVAFIHFDAHLDRGKGKFGAFGVVLQYEDARVTSGGHQGQYIYANGTWKMGKNLWVLAYGQRTGMEETNLTTADATYIALGGIYGFSKKTRLYYGYRNTDVKDVGKQDVIAVGLRADF